MPGHLAGGLPYFDQPRGLLLLLQGVRAHGLHTVVYTGYPIERLAARPEPEVHAALRLVDLLVDGPYMTELADGAGAWRGSRNQRLIPRPATWLGSGRSGQPHPR